MMKYFTYGAIVIGSQEITLKIYEISPETGIRQIDHVSLYYDISQDSYTRRKLNVEKVEEICEILLKLKEKMAEYNVQETECIGTGAFRSLYNREMVISRIRLKTGLTIEVPGNTEMRLLMYKGITLKREDFNKMIEKNTAILDISTSSLQISLFDKQALSVTQNIRIGTLKNHAFLSKIEKNSPEYFSIIEEYIGCELDMFRTIYLKDKTIKNVIAIGNSSTSWEKIAPELSIGDYLTGEQVLYLYKKLRKSTTGQITMEYELPYETARYMIPSILIYKNFLEKSKAEIIWLTKTNLCDGMAVDYAERKNKILPTHDFDKDIIMAAKNFAKRYRIDKKHTDFVTKAALSIFDCIRKEHGMGKRERLLLELACLLHECGKYVNMNEPGINGYRLILSTEMIGISQRERKLVANMVYYQMEEIPAYEDQEIREPSDYLMVAQMTAIMRLAEVLDAGHKQKLTDLSFTKKKGKLIISGKPQEDMRLESSLLEEKADYFEEIYGIRPVLRQKRG